MDKTTFLTQAGIDYQAAMARFSNKEDLYFKFLFRLPEEPMMNDCVTAFNSGNYEGAINSAHTLKGVAANLNVPKLAQVCHNFIFALRSGDTVSAGALLPDVTDEFERVSQAIILMRSGAYATV